MSTSKTGKTTHDNTVNKAEAARQVAIPPTAASGTQPTKAAVIAADVTFHQAAALSAIADGTVSPVPFMTALRELGRTLYP